MPARPDATPGGAQALPETVVPDGRLAIHWND